MPRKQLEGVCHECGVHWVIYEEDFKEYSNITEEDGKLVLESNCEICMVETVYFREK